MTRNKCFLQRQVYVHSLMIIISRLKWEIAITHYQSLKTKKVRIIFAKMGEHGKRKGPLIFFLLFH